MQRIEDLTMRRLSIIFALALLAYLATGVAQVRPGERGVVRRFGRVVATPGPGLWVGLPWGLDAVDRVPVEKVRQVRVGFRRESEEADDPTPPGQLLTGDQNLVNVAAVIDYAVRPDDVVDYSAARDRVDGAVAR